MLGVSRNTVNRYESDVDGAEKPIVIMRWAEVSGYSYEWLLEGDEDHGAPTPESIPTADPRNTEGITLRYYDTFRADRIAA